MQSMEEDIHNDGLISVQKQNTRILCYSPYNLWTLHGLWEITILHALRHRGAEVRYVLCDGLYSDCDVFWAATRPRYSHSCNNCQNNVRSFVEKMRMPYEWLGKYLNRNDFALAESWASSLNAQDLYTARYGDWNIGEWVRGSVHSHFRLSTLDLSTQRIQEGYRSYVYSGLIACLGLSRLFDEFNPDSLLLFNGRLSSTRIAFEIASHQGIYVVCHERGSIHETIRLIQDATCLSLAPYRSMWNDWGNVPLSNNELCRIHQHLYERRYGINLNWKIYNPLPQESEQILRQLGLNKNRQVWALFTSSDDEVVSTEDWQGVFPRQIDWIEKTISYVEKYPEIDLVIRVHPNTAGKKATGSNVLQLREIQLLGKSLPSNVRLVMPDDPVSSYSLMDIASIGLVYMSTVGLEMACSGKPVIVASNTYYSNLPFVQTVSGSNLYEDMLHRARTGALPDSFGEMQRLAYRFAYGLFYRLNIPFPLVKMPNPHQGIPSYKSLDSLIPGCDPNLDRISRIILNREPICLPPTDEEKSRTAEDEDSFLARLRSENAQCLSSTGKNADPLVSVIIPCYKYGKYLRECVESVLQQTYRNFEIIIVNDGSPDNTKDVAEQLIAEYRNYHIILINQPNSGQPAISRNRGIENAEGKYILPLDADDALVPTMIEECVNELECYPSIAIAYTDRQDFDGSDMVVRALDYDFEKLKYANHISYCSLYRREVWEKIGGYRTNVKGLEDWDFWIAAGALNFRGLRIPKPLFKYRRHDSGVFQEAVRDYQRKFAQIILNNHSVYKNTDVASAENFLGIQRSVSARELSPVVSVIVPTYNRPEMLTEALKSILNQTYRNFEVIVVNDAGVDVENIISSLNTDNNITYIKHGGNRGLAAARNTGIRSARGEYIALLDDDDIFYKDHLETAFQHLCDNAFRVVYTDASRATFSVKDRAYELVKKNVPYSIDYDRNKLLLGNLAPVNCFVFSRELAIRAGLFDETLSTLEDWDFWIRLSALTPFKHIKKVTVQVNWRTDGSTMTSSRKTEFKMNRNRIYKKYQDELSKIPNRNEILAEFNAIWSSDFDEKREKSGVFREAVKGLTSIVILTFNQLKYTRECVESIRKHTPEPHEIIFVDNGSTDGTVKWLRKLLKENLNYKLIENHKNLGFPMGCNQGINASSGEYILLLNNDVVVTNGWLSGMLECLNSAPDIGIVGPMTNNISGNQRLDTRYRSMADLNVFAQSFRERNRHRRVPSRRIVGFCMLFRRELVEKIGLLDETFGTGNFEDDDFCLRAALEGYKNFIAGDIFIHHYGSMSFRGNRMDYSSAMTGNRKIFKEKWSGIERKSSLGGKVLVLSALEDADTWNHKGKLDVAAEMLLEGIRHAPTEKRLYYALSEILIEAKQFKDAYEILKEMSLDESDLRRLELIGYCAEGMECYDEAEEHAGSALSLNPASAPALNLKGILAHKKEDNEKAQEFFQKAIKADPGFGEPYTNSGVLNWAAGQREEALDLLERGCILSPTVSDIVTSYHSAISTLVRFERAEKVFREAQAIYPLNRRIAFLLIDTLIQQGKNDIAMREIEKAIVTFGIEEGILSAALKIRETLGPRKIEGHQSSRHPISLCMIVKNEEQYIAQCLMSVRAVVDEMIVVDTGSTDRTKDIAKTFGAQVYDFQWTHNFAEARNFSLAQAHGDWILVLDADEIISSRDYAALTDLIKKQKPVAYSFTTRNYTGNVNTEGWVPNDGKYYAEEAADGWFQSQKVRLFPRDHRIHFENHVHELVEPSLRRAGIEIQKCEIPIHHYGRLNQERDAAKEEAYYELGKAKLQEKGDDVKALSELAVTAGTVGKYEEAIELWQRAIAIKPDFVKAFVNLGYVYLQLQRYEDALVVSKRAVELAPDQKETVLNYASAEVHAGNVKKAISVLEHLLNKIPEYPPAMGVLAAAYCIEGKKEKGLAYIEKIKKLGFNCPEFLYKHARSLKSAKRAHYAIRLLEAAVESKHVNNDITLLLSELQSGNGCERLA